MTMNHSKVWAFEGKRAHKMVVIYSINVQGPLTSSVVYLPQPYSAYGAYDMCCVARHCNAMTV